METDLADGNQEWKVIDKYFLFVCNNFSLIQSE